MPKKRRKPKAQASLSDVIVKALLGSFVCAAVFFLLTALASLICLKKDAAPEAYKFFVLAVGAVSGFIGGYAAVRPVRKKGIIVGALSTLPAYFAVACISLAFSHSGIGTIGWILCAVMLAAGAAGGIIAVN